MLYWRVITAIFLIPLVLWGIISLSPLGFEAVTAIVFLIGAMEWTTLCDYRQIKSKAIFLSLFLLVLAVIKLTQFVGPIISYSWCGLAVLFWLFAWYWVKTYRAVTPPFLNKSFNRAIIGILCLSSAWLALNLVRSLDFGREWIIFLFILIWSTDTFAYFVGRKWGKAPLAPYVSPKKTYEGFWGGVIGSIFAAFCTVALLQLEFFHTIKPWLFEVKNLAILLSVVFVTILLAVLGDLFESLLKRIVGIKDSGAILPGHGGILDRFDSLISALPFYALSLVWLQGR